MNKRLKLPNGFGSITKKSGNRRRPFEIRKFVDGRHTLASLLNNADANPTAIKRILGHASSNITEKHYTHKDLHQLKKAMDLIVFKY